MSKFANTETVIRLYDSNTSIAHIEVRTGEVDGTVELVTPCQASQDHFGEAEISITAGQARQLADVLYRIADATEDRI